MAELETRVDKLEGRVSNIEIQVTAMLSKMDVFMADMRDRDNQRAEDIRTLRAETDAKLTAMQAATDAKLENMRKETDAKLAETNEKIATLQASTDSRFEKIEKKLDSLGEHINTLVTAAVVGIGASVIAVFGIAYSVLSKGG